MSPDQALDIGRQALVLVLLLSAPVLLLGLTVGVLISILQSVTQIQEMTLTFVPKMIAVFVAASLTASFVGAKFSIFTQSIYARIEQGYK